MITYKQVLSTLRGSGKLRKPKKDFWELRSHWKKVLHLAGVRVFQDTLTPRDPGPWLVNISDFTPDSLTWALAQILPDGEGALAQEPPPPLPPNGPLLVVAATPNPKNPATSQQKTCL